MRSDFAPEFRAQIGWVRNDADPPEVEPVGIPTGRDRRILMKPALGMPLARVAQQLESRVIELVRASSKARGKRGTPGSVTRILPVIFPAAVVKESEQTDDRDIGTGASGEQQGIPLDAPPMARSMHRIFRPMELTGNEFPKAVEIVSHLFSKRKSPPCRDKEPM